MNRKLEQFKPIDPKGKKVLFYHCGPTVYWTQHIGNMRAMVMGDLIRRSLLYLGYDVKYVRNYTDFGHLSSDADTGEDKMEKGAKREGLSPQEIADKYIVQFERDVEALKILKPTVVARATDYIQAMIDLIKTLLDKSFAYSTPLAVYFDISKFARYTKLSRRDLDKDRVGAGAGEITDANKKNPADFALWFFKTGAHKNALQYWPSPFDSPEVENGEGIPGWHIECSAMVKAVLGPTIDIHMGGVEHISIHHPNEIAQSECASGVPLANYWAHNEHLWIDGRKMSKSLGNIYSVGDLIEKGYDPLYLRYFYLQAHYRAKQNFTFKALDAAKSAYVKLTRRITDLGDKKGEVDGGYKKKFEEFLKDDFNIPRALALVRKVLNDSLAKSDKLATILDFDRVFGLNLDALVAKIPKEYQEIIELYKEARSKKDYEVSDQIRDELIEAGFIVRGDEVTY